MAGHSKWANIKHRKGAQDAKRGKIFTKIIKEITVAARMGGGDPGSNPRLRKAVSNGRANNLPVDNIKRAIQKGTGELPGVSYEEATYEGYGPGGVAIMMEIITDNKNRTVAEIRHLMSKNNGNLGENGSVAWMFDRKGQIIMDASVGEEDAVFEDALEAGADDFESEDGLYTVVTEPTNLMDVRDRLEAKGYEIKSAELDLIPKNLQKVETNDVPKILKLMEALDDNDDISHVYANFDIDESDMPQE
ncbi:MAG: YebC/PmpR family DNA-binding transcriptional regulator [Candidatus Marinimicrobia bacterium]|nr:YebC/PmpR family DNA-binding transcriptional regulator [Candidatus Neomarinimicrobiota bacterium]